MAFRGEWAPGLQYPVGDMATFGGNLYICKGLGLMPSGVSPATSTLWERLGAGPMGADGRDGEPGYPGPPGERGNRGLRGRSPVAAGDVSPVEAALRYLELHSSDNQRSFDPVLTPQRERDPLYVQARAVVARAMIRRT